MIQKIRAKCNSNQKGFTLIELMIVIAIIGILAAIAVPQFLSYRMRSYNTAAKAVANNVKADQGNLNAEFGVFGHTTGDVQQLNAGDTGNGPYSATTAVNAFAAVPNTPGARIATTRLDTSALQGAVGIALGLNMNCTATNVNDANNNSSFIVFARHVKGDTAYCIDSDIENQLYMDNDPDAYVNTLVITAPTGTPAVATNPVDDCTRLTYSIVP